jgi:hypothetical protein
LGICEVSRSSERSSEIFSERGGERGSERGSGFDAVLVSPGMDARKWKGLTEAVPEV